MKTAIYLNKSFEPTVGGNFSYMEKFITAIDNHAFSSPLDICFVGRLSEKDIKTDKPYHRLASSSSYAASRALIKSGIHGLVQKAIGLNLDFCSLRDRSILRSQQVDVVLFPSQFLKAVNNFPFITMNWDAGHKTTFAFPELLENFKVREKWYREDIQEALSIFVESQSSKKEFVEYYATPPHKIEVIPLFAGGVVDIAVAEQEQTEILSRFGLQKNSYFYYPAQFWAHKNHYNLLEAFKKLKEDSGKNVRLVFSGSDMGNKDYIKSVIQRLGLDQDVSMLGFISNQEVHTLYRNAIALVMPTFLGPTNMPLLEAQALSTAIICSDLAGHREQCADGALYANPADPGAWVSAMTKVLDPTYRADLIRKADGVRANSPFNIQECVRRFEAALLKLSAVRKTFP